jgi:hypothetical protein
MCAAARFRLFIVVLVSKGSKYYNKNHNFGNFGWMGNVFALFCRETRSEGI